MSTDDRPLPYATRRAADVPGHWLLARVGKRVLRPGGRELTTALLDHAELAGAHVVELAPGLGRTAVEILAAGPASYTGVDADPDAVSIVGRAVTGHGRCLCAEASSTGLATGSADCVIGEAMLTMQSDRGKRAIVAEAARLLSPGGRYAIHELALRPDDLDESTKDAVRVELARAIKVNARPLTVAEWRTLLGEHGLVVEWVRTSPMALLQMRRNIVDEGLVGTLRIVRNLLSDAEIRRRVLTMRTVFRRHRRALTAVAIVARRPADGEGAR